MQPQFLLALCGCACALAWSRAAAQPVRERRGVAHGGGSEIVEDGPGHSQPHIVQVAVPQPHPVEVKHELIYPIHKPYPLEVHVPVPFAVPVVKTITIPVEKPVPQYVEKIVPYPVEKHYPVTVEKHVPLPIPKPIPIKVPIVKTVHHYVKH